MNRRGMLAALGTVITAGCAGWRPRLQKPTLDQLKTQLKGAEWRGNPIVLHAHFTPVENISAGWPPTTYYRKVLVAEMPDGKEWVRVPCVWSQRDVDRNTPEQMKTLMNSINLNAQYSLEALVWKEKGLLVHCSVVQ